MLVHHPPAFLLIRLLPAQEPVLHNTHCLFSSPGSAHSVSCLRKLCLPRRYENSLLITFQNTFALLSMVYT